MAVAAVAKGAALIRHNAVVIRFDDDGEEMTYYHDKLSREENVELANKMFARMKERQKTGTAAGKARLVEG